MVTTAKYIKGKKKKINMTREVSKKEIDCLVLNKLGKSDLEHNIQRAEHICNELGYKAMQHYVGFASKIKKYNHAKAKIFFNDFEYYLEDILHFYNNDKEAVSDLIQLYNHQSQYSIKLNKKPILVVEKDDENKSFTLDFWVNNSLKDFYQKLDNILLNSYAPRYQKN